MSTIKQVRDGIIAALNTKKGGGQLLQEVFGYIEPTPQQFPCAMVDVFGQGTDVFLTTADNLLKIRFLVHVELLVKNNQSTADLRIDLMEELRNLFSTTPYVDTLNNLVEICEVEFIQVFNDDQSESPKTGFDMILICSMVRTT